ncbi:hypothetical protein [Paenibacillus sinopodophylli]|uniref:hypothetical protein n=1 Tax=Paenibacillus sinopodophylli TaxID=1837342 RepID=UPI0014861A0C|nr:hypothetical protein [Paenibacillus sinopodophylli]
MQDLFDVHIQSRIETIGKALENHPNYSKLAKSSSVYYSKLWREMPKELKE